MARPFGVAALPSLITAVTPRGRVAKGIEADPRAEPDATAEELDEVSAARGEVDDEHEQTQVTATAPARMYAPFG